MNANFICVDSRLFAAERFFMKLVSLLLMAAAAFAQTKPAPTKSALDKAALETYLRHVELWIPEVQVTIDDAKPAPELPSFLEVTVHLSYKGGIKDERYLVSKDGKKILKGDVYDIDHNPFQANLDKLKTDLQPTFAAAGAPVVLAIFNDFHFPLPNQK